jgi:hypothetical protein
MRKQVRLRGNELVRAAQLGNEEVRLKLPLHPERVQRVPRCGQNVLHAVEHVRRAVLSSCAGIPASGRPLFRGSAFGQSPRQLIDEPFVLPEGPDLGNHPKPAIHNRLKSGQR